MSLFPFKKETKKHLCFYIWSHSALDIFFLSELTGWSRPAGMHLPVKQEERLLPVWIACLCGQLSSLTNFAPAPGATEVLYEEQRNVGCWVVSSGGVGLGVTSQLQKGTVVTSQCGCNRDKREFWKPGAPHTCMCSFHLA